LNIFIGIDTSAYTTSIAIADENSRIVADERMMLEVEPGLRGLRQSDAHFAHIRNLPVLMDKVAALLRDNRILAIGVSDRPRRISDSYMPVFTAGLNVARCLANICPCPLYLFSHQEGHIEAAVYDIPLEDSEFLAVHFSGGTSEILFVSRDQSRFSIDILLATTDLNAGQLVDRVGVAMGLPFPAGPALEKIAGDQDNDLTLPSALDERGFSFSGAETKILAMLEQGVAPETLAYLVFRMIANTLEKGIRKAVGQTGINRVVMSGGVMANEIIRNRLTTRLTGAGIELFWAPLHLSTDNAVGTAMLTRNTYYLENEVLF